MHGFIDLHCHVLPGLDDGPATVAEAVTLTAALAGAGFEELHPTPHQILGRWAPDHAARQEAATVLSEALIAERVTIGLKEPAGENMWDGLFLERQRDLDFPKYAGDKAFLLEFPPGRLPPGLRDRLFELRLRGLLPVIAHVERYPEILSNPDVLAGKAALLVNLSTLGGLAGWRLRRATRRMVLEGKVHALATDSHGLPDFEYTAAGLAWLEKAGGTDSLRRMLIDGPSCLLAGEIPEG